ARGAYLVPPDHHRVAPAEARLHAFDGGVEFAMQIFHAIRGHRRVSDFGRLGFCSHRSVLYFAVDNTDDTNRAAARSSAAATRLVCSAVRARSRASSASAMPGSTSGA